MLITSNIAEIIAPFRQGSIIAYPTEAVFGLGCDPDNDEAIQRLLHIKQRPANKGLILVAAHFSQVEKYLQPLSSAQEIFTKPSDTTYLFPAKASTSSYLTGHFTSVAIRISLHPVVQSLCETLDSAIVSTSANLSGHPPAKTENEVLAQLNQKIDVILQGDVGELRNPTVIRDSISGQIIRS